MKVLLTGGTGFIGSGLISKLVELEHDVYCLERYVTGRYVLGDQHKVKTIFGDLRDNFSIRRIISDVQPDVVIHLAGLISVEESIKNPNIYLKNNLVASMNILESMRKTNVNKIIF